MKLRFLSMVLVVFIAVGMLAAQTGSQSAPSKLAASGTVATTVSSPIQQKVESYLRHMYAWGPSFKITFGTLTESPIPGLYTVNVDVSANGQTDSAKFYVSKDGRYLMRADLEDMNSDPIAEVRKQISLAGSPSKGPADATIVLVEYADYECPSCRQLDGILRSVLPRFPQVRLIYKDFPLTQIHPWANTAATAGRCAYKQNPTAFWKFHDMIYDGQELISAENVWEKLQDYAAQAGLDAPSLRACMSQPQAQEEINKSISEGEALHIANTPTIFVNGRRLIAPDEAMLTQFIRYELAHH